MRKIDSGDGTTAVTFVLPAGMTAGQVSVCGDFNDWEPACNVLRRQDDGSYETTVVLGPGRHHFRYLLDSGMWINDAAADDYEPNPFGGQNSIVDLGQPSPAVAWPRPTSDAAPS